ncbi:MAG: DUF6798 domain-containing protein [Candidatus Kariarchaeaceae archaeon]
MKSVREVDLPHKFINWLQNSFIFSVISLILSLVWNGYSFGTDDHILQIPLAKSYIDSSLYPHDPLFHQTGYKSFIWELLAFSSKYIELWIIIFISYCIILGIYFNFIFRIGELVSGSAIGGIILTALLIVPKPGLGTDIMTHENWLSTRLIASPLIMAAFYYALQQKHYRSFVILGVAFNLHPISASHSAFIIGFNLLIIAVKSRSRYHLITLSKAVFLFILFASPLLIVILLRIKSNESSSLSFIADKSWLKIMHYRNPHMAFPSEFSLFVYLSVVVYVIIIWISKNNLDSKYLDQIMNWIYGIFILFLLNILIADVFPVEILIQLQFARSLKFLSLFTMIFLVSSLLKIDSFNQLRNDEIFFLVAFCLMVFSSYFLPTLLISTIIFLITRNNFSTDFEFNWSNFHKQKRLLLVSSIIVIAITPHLIFKITSGKPPLLDINTRDSNENPWVDIQLWVKENTPKSSIIITPPHVDGFRVHSERSIIGEWKDGTLSFFNSTYASEWWQRMIDLGYNDVNYMNYNFGVYHSLNFSKIIEKYDASHLISQELAHSQFGKIMYQNDNFLVIGV